MSTKTLRKRIALVAVSALTAGLVSVVAVPTANAAAGTTTVDSLQLATTSSTTGEGSANQAVASQLSSGWVTQTSTTATANGNGLKLISGAAATGIVLAGAKLAFSVGSNTTSANGISVVVTGGTINSGQNTASINVTWGSSGAGTVSVAETVTATSCTTVAAPYNVTKNPLPTATVGTLAVSSSLLYFNNGSGWVQVVTL
jgi:hypothetical protein